MLCICSYAFSVFIIISRYCLLMLTVEEKLQPVTQLNARAIRFNFDHQFTLKSLGGYLLSSHPLQLEKDVSFQNIQVLLNSVVSLFVTYKLSYASDCHW